MTALFHWIAEDINNDEWMEILANAGRKVGAEVEVFGNDSRVQVLLDKTLLDIRVKGQKARDSIGANIGCWKAVMMLLLLSKSYAINIVDDESKTVSTRSLRKLTGLGFNEVEFDNFGESIGLINQKVARSAAFMKF